MIQRDYLIVGGGIGAASACETLRQHDPKGTVTLVSNEAYLPYHRPALSKTVLRRSKNWRRNPRIGTAKEISSFAWPP
jgi:NADPH-dependent 2,4-dienoyl-CoA reductase/sulfur reductase-like enzyme